MIFVVFISLTSIKHDYFVTGDSFSHHNDMKFSTFDQDNDLRNSSTHKIPGVNCALMFGGGWWFKNCHDVNLNGIYGDWQETVNSSYYAVGIHWTKITNHKFSLKSSIMKIRPCIPSDNCTSQNWSDSIQQLLFNRSWLINIDYHSV